MIGRVNAGGGGSLQATDAILRVIAPAGSTVTISKGGVSKSDAGQENAADNTLYDYYFIIHASQFDSVNPWTVTATLGGDTASDTVIIDSADEYDVVLDYGNFFFVNGNWGNLAPIKELNSTTGATGSFSISGDLLVLQGGAVTSSSSGTAVFTPTSGIIDLTNFSTYYVIVDSTSGGTNSSRVATLCVSSTEVGSMEATPSYTSIPKTTTQTRYAIDVSNLNGEYYLQIRFYVGGGTADASKTVNVVEWGLEE